MRVALAALCLLAVAGSAVAQPQQTQAPPPGVLDQVYACSSITDQAQRLACYDNAVGQMRQAQQSGDLVAVDRQQAQTIEREAFGFSLPSLPRLFGGGRERQNSNGTTVIESSVVNLEATITRVQMRGDGTAIFTLDNGQVWQQIDNENPRMARSGGKVDVHRASMGSFLMSVDAGGPALRVRRIQ